VLLRLFSSSLPLIQREVAYKVPGIR
jgi:hypothetical protein